MICVWLCCFYSCCMLLIVVLRWMRPLRSYTPSSASSKTSCFSLCFHWSSVNFRGFCFFWRHEWCSRSRSGYHIQLTVASIVLFHFNYLYQSRNAASVCLVLACCFVCLSCLFILYVCLVSACLVFVLSVLTLCFVSLFTDHGNCRVCFYSLWSHPWQFLYFESKSYDIWCVWFVG